MNRLGGWASAAPVLILALFFAVALVLMLAGYGAAVAVGVLSGLVIGGVIGGIVGLWLSVKGRERSLTIGGTSFGSNDASPSNRMFAFLQDMDRVQRVDYGELLRVVAGGMSATASGVRVELIALELRSTGGVGYLTASAEPPTGTLGSFARVEVEDDVGTEYAAAAMSGNASPDRSRFDLRFAPAPPPGADVLTIRIDELADPFAPVVDRPSVIGPWVLSVPLSGVD